MGGILSTTNLEPAFKVFVCYYGEGKGQSICSSTNIPWEVTLVEILQIQRALNTGLWETGTSKDQGHGCGAPNERTREREHTLCR